MTNIDSIAIIDDDHVCQFTTKKIIENAHVAKTIFIFSEGKEAYDYLSAYANKPEKLPDIILLDINMPVMDGFEFLKYFSELKPTFKKKIDIHVFSSSIDFGDVTRIKSFSEVTDVVGKPFTAKKLNNIISSFCSF